MGKSYRVYVLQNPARRDYVGMREYVETRLLQLNAGALSECTSPLLDARGSGFTTACAWAGGKSDASLVVRAAAR